MQRALIYFPEDHNQFIESFSLPPPVSIRYNPFKRCDEFSNTSLIQWSVEGRYLEVRPSFTFDPLFHAGCYYVQEASSQFIEIVFNKIRSELNGELSILDMCAAPGGKSTHLLSMLKKNDVLVSNEIIPSRNNILRHNIIKWGTDNCIITQNDPSDFNSLHEYFDVILVDAPCSGEGLFRKDEKSIDEWSPENVNQCVIRQKDILKHAVNSLKPGGYLIYSTCTYEPAENDLQIKSIIENYDMELIHVDPDNNNIIKGKYGNHFFPHKIKGEGFFISLLKKRSNLLNGKIKKANSPKIISSPAASAYLKYPAEYYFIEIAEKIFAIPKIHFSLFKEISSLLFVRHAGIYTGDKKGNDFNPSPSLALSIHLRDDISQRNVSKDDAVKFLRGESLVSDGSAGWQLISFNNFNLGWIKNIGQRTNNYYPKEWRIKNQASRI